jgi:hypothetical protein
MLTRALNLRQGDVFVFLDHSVHAADVLFEVLVERSRRLSSMRVRRLGESAKGFWLGRDYSVFRLLEGGCRRC